MLGQSGILEGYFTKNENHLRTATAQARALQEDQQHWISRLDAIHTKRQWSQAITETKTVSLEGPLFSYLGNVIPPQMILHEAAVKHTDDIWDLELSGRTSANLPSALLLVDQLAQQLAQGPYHVTVKAGLAGAAPEPDRRPNIEWGYATVLPMVIEGKFLMNSWWGNKILVPSYLSFLKSIQHDIHAYWKPYVCGLDERWKSS